MNTTPLFQVVFALQNAPLDKQQLKQLEVTRQAGESCGYGWIWRSMPMSVEARSRCNGGTTGICLTGGGWSRWPGTMYGCWTQWSGNLAAPPDE